MSCVTFINNFEMPSEMPSFQFGDQSNELDNKVNSACQKSIFNSDGTELDINNIAFGDLATKFHVKDFDENIVTLPHYFKNKDEQPSHVNQWTRKLSLISEAQTKEEKRDPFTELDQEVKDSAASIAQRFAQRRKRIERTALVGQQILGVKFSQKTISAQTTEREGDPSISIDKLQELMATKGWDSEKPRLRCVRMPDDSIASYDNRRLFVAKKVAKKDSNFKMLVEIYPHDMSNSRLVESMSKYRSEYERIPSPPQDIEFDTYGYAIWYRMTGCNGDIKISDEYGFCKDPEVR